MTAISGRFSLALLSIFFIALYSPTADAAPITGDEMLSDCTAYVNQSQQSSEDELVKQIECVYFINGKFRKDTQERPRQGSESLPRLLGFRKKRS